MKKPNQNWNRYLSSKTVRPKIFMVTMERDTDGTFRIVGNGAQMLKVINQYANDVVDVDVRDLANAINTSGIVAN